MSQVAEELSVVRVRTSVAEYVLQVGKRELARARERIGDFVEPHRQGRTELDRLHDVIFGVVAGLTGEGLPYRPVDLQDDVAPALPDIGRHQRIGLEPSPFPVGEPDGLRVEAVHRRPHVIVVVRPGRSHQDTDGDGRIALVVLVHVDPAEERLLPRPSDRFLEGEVRDDVTDPLLKGAVVVAREGHLYALPHGMLRPPDLKRCTRIFVLLYHAFFHATIELLSPQIYRKLFNNLSLIIKILCSFNNSSLLLCVQ